jgi:hypothetical protein
VIARLLSRNGTGFGLGLFGSLPTETTNGAPELVPRAVVREAYFALMQWWERQQGGAWLNLAEAHYGRMVEPNHLQRCLDILASLPRLDEPDALGRWLDERDAESAAIPDDARHRLFDEWFAAGYEEADEGNRMTYDPGRFREVDAETFQAAWHKAVREVRERPALTQTEHDAGWRQDPSGLRLNVVTGELDDTCFIHLAPRPPS